MRHFFEIPTAYAGSITNATPLAEILTRVLQFLLSIAGMIAIIGLVIAGILYLTAAGDLRQIATAKRAAIFSVIGVVVVLGAFILISQIAEFFS